MKVLLLVVLLALPARADDTPRRIDLGGGWEKWNKAAVEAVDKEIRTLQQAEMDDHAENERLRQSTPAFILMGLGIGLVVGAGVGIGIGVGLSKLGR